jgi:hypothetical protein
MSNNPGPIGDIEFLPDPLQVFLYGMLADLRRSGDLFIRLSLEKKADHRFFLLSNERTEPRVCCALRGPQSGSEDVLFGQIRHLATRKPARSGSDYLIKAWSVLAAMLNEKILAQLEKRGRQQH